MRPELPAVMARVRVRLSAKESDIDARAATFLDRPLEDDWPYLWLDATYLKSDFYS